MPLTAIPEASTLRTPCLAAGTGEAPFQCSETRSTPERFLERPSSLHAYLQLTCALRNFSHRAFDTGQAEKARVQLRSAIRLGEFRFVLGVWGFEERASWPQTTIAETPFEKLCVRRRGAGVEGNLDCNLVESST